MTIHWISLSEEKGDTVSYRENEGNEWIVAVGKHWDFPKNDQYLIHIVELTQLKPNTIYQFKIGNDQNTYKFRTMPKNLDVPIRFVVGGDMYHDDIETLEKTSRRAARENPMFALIGGDIAYAYSSKGNPKPGRWLEFLISWKNTMITTDGLMIPIIPSVGNHDVSQTDKAIYFYTLFAMPGASGYNLLDFSGYMSIFLLDSGHIFPVGGDQTRWLQQALSDRDKMAHKFALYHVPAWPSVRSLLDNTSTQIRLNWVPLFEKYGLDAAFENHNHAYKRTPKIFQQKVNNERGILYVGDGGWGVGKVRTPKSPKREWYLSKTAMERYFLLVTLNGENRNFKAINADGVTFDEF